MKGKVKTTDSDDQHLDIEDIYPLSPMQMGMLFQSLLDPHSGMFLEQQVIQLATPFDSAAFEKAWSAVIARNASLRTSFHWQDLENPVQIVWRDIVVPIEHKNWSDAPQTERERLLQEHLAIVREEGLDFETPPLMRVVLAKVSRYEVWFIWHFHHILLDGWSGQLVLQELVDQYKALLNNENYIAPKRRPYSSYIAWLSQQDVAAAESFWRARLEGFMAPTQLGWQNGRCTEANEAGYIDDRLLFNLPVVKTKALNEFARNNRLTLNTLIQGAWALILSHFSGEKDVLFGSVVSGRPADLPGIETMIGLFINTLPQRVQIYPQMKLSPWLKIIQASQMEAARFQFVSPLQLQQWSEFPRRMKLFDTVLVFENFPTVPAANDNSKSLDEPLYLGRTDVTLAIMVVPGETLKFKFVYDKRRMEKETVRRLASYFETVLTAMPLSGEAMLGSIQVMPSQERNRILIEWNDTARPGYDQAPLMRLLEHQVQKTPGAIAFIDGGTHISMYDLNERANQLAHFLISKGVLPKEVVGVHLVRSIDLVLCFLAILKARAVYLPLDPSYPSDRLGYMVDDTGSRVVLSRTPASFKVQHFIDLTEFDKTAGAFSRDTPMPLAQVDDPSYVLYTSGSTGIPKGVVANYRQILNRLFWMWDNYPFAENEVGVMRTAINFVDTFWEMLGPLLKGVPTVIAPDNVVREPRVFVSFLATHQVTRLWFVPSYLEMLLHECADAGNSLPLLKQWWSGGEMLSVDLYRRFKKAVPHGMMFNVYGASELWDATVFEPDKEEVYPIQVSIGRPISNTHVYILDERYQPVPIGAVGRLYFAGACLALRYIDDALSSERFLPNPFSNRPGDRIYDSGDLAFYRADGAIELVGRRDHQINLRGFRIEPTEVEAILDRHPHIRESAVTVKTISNHDDRLVAYAVLENEAVSVRELLAFAAKHLPTFMIPSSVVWLNEMPRTASGKLDRNALAHYDAVPSDISAESREDPIINPIQKKLIEIFKAILGLDSIGIHDDFFRDLGGHSLLATRLVSQLRDKFAVDVPLRIIFDYPTVATLGERISVVTAEKDDGISELLVEVQNMDPDEMERLISALDDESKKEPT